MPAKRAQWLRAVADIRDEAQQKPVQKAQENAEHQARLDELKKRVGMG